MPSSLPVSGVVSYNGVDLNTPYLQTLDFSSEPISDRSGRSIMYNLITLKLKTTIFAQTTDATMLELRRKLTQFGGRLIYTGRGAGPIDVNGSGAKDVAWGPKPKILSWKNMGAGNAAEVEWTVQVAIPDFCSSPRYANAIMALTYRYSVTQDQSGYSRRTISGNIQIPQTRRNAEDNRLSDCVDNYKEETIPSPPRGFRRVSSSWDVDESKCSADFSYVDEEMPPNIPPPGVVQIDASHDVASGEEGLIRWRGTIGATYELAKGLNGQQAWPHFQEMALSRLETTQRYSLIGKTNQRAPVIITALSFSEPEIYGKKQASFSLEYTFSTSLKTILLASALWTEVPGSDYNAWRLSLGQTVFHSRGNARLALRPEDDALVSLCSRSAITMRASGQQRALQSKRALILDQPRPSPDESWLMYSASLRIEQQDHIVRTKPLPTKPLKVELRGGELDMGNGRGQVGGLSGGGRIENAQTGYQPYKGNFKADNVQLRASPSLAVVIEGRAARAGYLIDPPVIESIAGVSAIPANRPGKNGFWIKEIASYGVPIVGAIFSLRYILPEIPRVPFGVPPDPFLES